MDNHPIPQDVTHFQFKLIGELTIKQFGYIAAGGVSAWITISVPVFILIKLPIALLFAGTGLILAFIPIEGRPADMMLTYFCKALLRPNQYIFHKQGSMLTSITAPKNAPPVVATQPETTEPAPAPTQLSEIQKQYIQATTMPMTQTIPTPIPVGYQPPKQTIPIPNTPIKTPLPTITPKPASVPPVLPINQPITTPTPVQIQPMQQRPLMQTVQLQNTSPVENQLQNTLAQKKQLEEQLAKLQQQLAQTTPQAPQPTQPAPVPQPITVASPVVKKIENPQEATTIPIASDFPNIIMGVIKDSRGNILPNMLIEVKDQDNNPVRAFKTNALGQFASATPLLNGTYTMSFEDPTKKHTFDSLQIAVRGDIMQPIEIISFDEREGLRKELFG